MIKGTWGQGTEVGSKGNELPSERQALGSIPAWGEKEKSKTEEKEKTDNEERAL